MPPERTHLADVSVIMPAYRAGRTIRGALASIARQTLKPAEVIVVDDGSDDGTADAARAMAGTLAPIALHVMAQENRGAGAARNRAIERAAGAYLAFLDADDEWMEEKLARSMAHLDGTDRILVAHDAILRDPAGRESPIDCSRHFHGARDPYAALYRTGYIASLTVVARKDAVRAAGGFDETLPAAQDFDLWLKMLADPKARFTVFPEALSLYNVNESGITSATARRLACTLRVAMAHVGALKSRPGSPLASLAYRILAVHFEAFSAFLKSGRTLKALGVLPALAVQFPVLILAYLIPNSLKAPLLWAWVAFAFALYAIQFRDIAGPALKVMGLGN